MRGLCSNNYRRVNAYCLGNEQKLSEYFRSLNFAVCMLEFGEFNTVETNKQ